MTINFETWEQLDMQIKKMIHRNGLTAGMIKEAVDGELNELVIKLPNGIETLFYGNGEACITVDYNGQDYEFVYVIDTYNEVDYIVNF